MPLTHWQPLSALPAAASMLDEHLAAARQQLDVLEKSVELFEPALRRQIDSVYSQQHELIPLFRVQICAWRDQALGDAATQIELQRLDAVLDQLHAVTARIIALAY